MDKRQVPFFSLADQGQNLKPKVLEKIGALIDQTDYVLGQDVSEFEKNFAKFCNSGHAVGVSNGTAAIYLALKSLGIGQGDEVILPAATFTASAQAICQLGATPVFVDVMEDTWTVSPSAIQAKVNPKTKAILVVHLYGNPCDMDEILAIAKQANIEVVEDAAQAHGALYQNQAVGSLGTFGCFSFYPSKNLGAMGDAGAVTFNDSKYNEQLRAYRNCGKDNEGVFKFMGFNYRMSTFQAAVLNVKLPYLCEWNARRSEIASRYDEEIHHEGFRKQRIRLGNFSARHLYVLWTENRDELSQYLKKNHIGFAYHYLSALHLQEPYHFLNYKRGAFPVSEALFDNCISIPLFPEMSDEEVERVISVLNAY